MKPFIPFLLMLSCVILQSFDDNDVDNVLKTGQIEIKVCQDTFCSGIAFWVVTKEIIVDWGDGHKYTPDAAEEAKKFICTHTYSNRDTQTIQIYTAGLTEFGVTITNVPKNGWEELRFGNCPNLEQIHCDQSTLKVLDVRKNKNLIWLECGSNQLTNLDVSRNTKLTRLDCFANQLTNLDVSQNTALKTLWCGYNLLTNLDVSKNTELDELWCSNNQLSTTALNAIMESLTYDDNRIKQGEIDIIDNPGTASCDETIATVKGWRIKPRMRMCSIPCE